MRVRWPIGHGAGTCHVRRLADAISVQQHTQDEGNGELLKNP